VSRRTVSPCGMFNACSSASRIVMSGPPRLLDGEAYATTTGA
jgi:hypothetical protein